ncbi:penicillin-binding transpeptidase domain-containing protein [Streptomyces sp. NPDC020141]|uniref:penicillin-binding transpeptidase domain-containing protein n=1 Tax=Streptomyces sp. NPDC020141 TaxID=3365065 RepID=UPI00379A8F7A
MRSGAKVAIIGGVFLVVAGGVGYGGYTVLSEGKTEDGPKAEKIRTGPPTAEEISRTSANFLAAWAEGRAPEAAQLTNKPVDAEPRLTDYRAKAKVSRSVITPGTPVGAKVPFTVEATVKHAEGEKPWSYSSELTVVRGTTTGRPVVDWKPSVLHPKLTATTTLLADETAAPPMKAVDHRNRPLTKEKHPSLGPVLDALRQRYGKEAGGTPASELVLSSTREGVADQTLLTLGKGTEGTLRTTLDADVQAAAERAVKRHKQASAVAVRPSTGEIRAIANSPAGGYNTAMLGAQAPGSTMKIVTAAMMLDKGVVKGPDAKVECPATVGWAGANFQNLDKFDIPKATFRQAFLKSCNTTFIKAVTPLGSGERDTALGETARKYFGIGLEWKTGVASFDGSVPASTGTETAASYIGQGKITMNALTMASVSATAKSGSFKQPVLVPASLDDRELARAEPLPGRVAAGLRDLMGATAEGAGTGRKAMATVRGDKGAKTGSAEVDGQGKSNSWFTGYADDLAAAAVVQSGGSGGDAAGPVVAQVLNAR